MQSQPQILSFGICPWYLN